MIVFEYQLNSSSNPIALSGSRPYRVIDGQQSVYGTEERLQFCSSNFCLNLLRGIIHIDSASQYKFYKMVRSKVYNSNTRRFEALLSKHFDEANVLTVCNATVGIMGTFYALGLSNSEIITTPLTGQVHLVV